jgi:LPS export ABC transporter protein LptC
MKHITLLCWGCFFLCCACGNSELNDLENVALQDAVGIERATDVEILYSDSAVVRVAVVAEVLLRNTDKKKPKNIFPKGLKADFFDENHRQTSKLTAMYGEQSMKERVVYLKDSVRIWNYKKELLETDELTWDERNKIISSTKFVRITTATQIIEGTGFKSNLEFTDWEIYEVSGLIESENLVEVPF